MMKSLILAGAAAAAIAAAPAAAQETQAAEVRVSDLDLTWEGDVAELDRRIDRAARRHCGAGGAADAASRDCLTAAAQRAATQRSELIARAHRGDSLRRATIRIS